MTNQLVFKHKLNHSTVIFYIVTVEIKADHTCWAASRGHISTFAFIADVFFDSFFANSHCKILVVKEIHPLSAFMAI